MPKEDQIRANLSSNNFKHLSGIGSSVYSASSSSEFKVAILANQVHSFPKLMAQGLQRMFMMLNIKSTIFNDGLSAVRRDARFLDQLALIEQLKHFDVVIMCYNLPLAFMDPYFNDEFIRSQLPEIPIVLYDNKYLGTMGGWILNLRDGNPQSKVDRPNNWGLNRFDWYLAASDTTSWPRVPEGPHPCSVIGTNLDEGTLFPDQKQKFIILFDFERKGYFSQRKIQLDACLETQTPYFILDGKYTTEQIRSIYRRCALYFVAHKESFGWPICEVQACGSYVGTPHSMWCCGHWKKEDSSLPGEGRLSENFIIYDNDKEKLKDAIRQMKANYDPYCVIQTYQRFRPELYYGDIEELDRFIRKVRNGDIHSRSHQGYPDIHQIGAAFEAYQQEENKNQNKFSAQINAGTQSVKNEMLYAK